MNEIIHKIKELNISLNEGINPSVISTLSKIFDFNFPQDFIDFYTKVNGFSGYQGFDGHHIWDTTKIEKEALIFSMNYDMIPFSDSVLFCPWIGFSKQNGKVYKGYGAATEFNEKTIFVAETFTDFLELYLADSDKLY
ncbi:MAG: SMI1/KNR4 family protein [Cyclobacteriaceae bacterium]